MKEKKQKVFKGMTAPVDVHLDIPEDEIWTYKIDGLAEPHINKPFTNFTLKKIIFTVLILIAVGLSMYFSVRVVSRVPFEYNEIGDGTYEFTKFNNTGYIGHLDIDYAVEIVYDSENTDPATNFTLKKDESKPISKIPQFCQGHFELNSLFGFLSIHFSPRAGQHRHQSPMATFPAG